MKRMLRLMVITLATASAAWALEVTPTVQMFTVKAGQRLNGQCTVTNDEGENLKVTMTSKDWFVLPANKGMEAKEWLRFPKPDFPLKQGESTTVPFEVLVPKKAQGELVGMMSFNLESEIPTNLKKVLSIAIYAAVAGTEKQKANLKALMITPSSGTFEVSALVENQGNVHIRPEGVCEILTSSEEKIATVFIEKGRPIYPGKEAVCTGKVRDFVLPAGSYKARLRITDVDRQTDAVKVTKKFEILENNSVDIK